MKLTLITTCCLLAAASQAVAQTGRNNFPAPRSKEAVKTAQEAAKVLEQAKASGLADLQRKVQEQPQAQRMEALVEKARQSGATEPTYADQARAAESSAQLDAAMDRLSPEGKALLAQSNTSPAMRAPEDAPVARSAVKASPLSSNTGGPKPLPLKPTPVAETPKVPAAETVITAGSVFFDSRQGFGVYVDTVVVNHPQFHLTCDELQVYMNKEEEGEKGADGKTAAAPPPPKALPTAGELAASGAAEKSADAADKDKEAGNSSLKRAIAKGRKVLINKMSDKGEPQTGIGREADYDGKTGDIILRGWPQIQEGRNLTVATEPSTYFLIKANGQFQTFGGRSQTRLIQEDDKKGAKGAGLTGPTTVPTAPGAAPAPVLNNRTQGGPQ